MINTHTHTHNSSVNVNGMPVEAFTPIKETYFQILVTGQAFKYEAALQINDSNKTAGKRARVLSRELIRLLKEFRHESARISR